MLEQSASLTSRPKGGRTPSALVTWLPSTSTILFVAVLALVTVAARGTFLSGDGDVAGHIAIGESILNSGAIVSSERLLYPVEGQPFLAFEWLSQVIMALCHRAGGLALVAALGAVLLAASYGGMVALLERKGVNVVWSLIAGVAAILLGASHWIARPHLFSWLFLVVLLHFAERSKDIRNSKLALVAIVPFFALWANLHAGFIYGLALLGLYAFGLAVESLRDRESRVFHLQRARCLALATVLGFIGGLITPHGFQLYSHLLGASRSRFLLDNTVEFQSPDFHVFGIQLAILAACLLLVGLARGRVRVSRLLAIVFLFGLSLYSVRHLAVFGLIGIPLVTLLVAENPSRLQADCFFVRGRRFRTSACLGLVAVAIVIWAGFSGGQLGAVRLFADSFSATRFPVSAVQTAREAGLQGRLLNEFSWGGYVHYAWPEQRAFIDGRSDFYGETLMRSYFTMSRLDSGWREEMAHWDFDIVMFPSHSSLVYELRRDASWQVWYEDNVAAILRRQR